MKTYKVLSPHIGDKPDPYLPGETRQVDANDAKALIAMGLIGEQDAGHTPEPEPEPEPAADPEPAAASHRRKS